MRRDTWITACRRESSTVKRIDRSCFHEHMVQFPLAENSCESGTDIWPSHHRNSGTATYCYEVNIHFWQHGRFWENEGWERNSWPVTNWGNVNMCLSSINYMLNLSDRTKSHSLIQIKHPDCLTDVDGQHSRWFLPPCLSQIVPFCFARDSVIGFTVSLGWAYYKAIMLW